jgi:hypothetical protein
MAYFSPILEHLHNEGTALVPILGDGNDFFLGNVDTVFDEDCEDTPLQVRTNFFEIMQERPSSSFTDIQCISEHSSSRSSLDKLTCDEPMLASQAGSRTSYSYNEPGSPCPEQHYFTSDYAHVNAVTPEFRRSNPTPISPPREATMFPRLDRVEEFHGMDCEDGVAESFESSRCYLSSRVYGAQQREADLHHRFQETLEALADCMKRTNASRTTLVRQIHHFPELYNDAETPELYFLTNIPNERSLEFQESRRGVLSFALDRLQDY